MNTFDLQMHSTASDGKHAPAEVVEMCHDARLTTMALTDHDAIDGVPEAIQEGLRLGVRVIPGIELSIAEHDAHLLGYGIDWNNTDLRAALDGFRKGRIEGAKKMVENLAGIGFVVDWEDVMKEAGNASVTRPHVARAVLNRPENKEKLRGIATSHDFIQAYLSNDSPHYVRRAHVSARDAIALIQKSNGIAVWAHPALHFRSSDGRMASDDLEQFLQELIAAGLQGIEVLSSSHTEDDTEALEIFARKHVILRTAGSDFHEVGPHAAHEGGLHSAERPGDFPTYGFSTDDILSRLEQAIEKQKNAPR